jgi:tetratricopeptide (TPR) repeat protein
MPRPVLLCAALLATSLASATTWGPAERIDPISGQKVQVQEIASYGTYIYRWPSKFDLVFWPFTDENWIWFCPGSGYVSFGNDFEKLSAEEKDRLKVWLRANYDPSKPPRTYFEKLDWLEKLYSVRQMDEAFWRWFYRVLAYAHRDDEAASLAYVRKALPLIEKHLASNPTGMARIEALYLLGEYSRRTGNIQKARECFAEVKTAKYKEKDGTEKEGSPYFLELVTDREALIDAKAAGGK